MIRKYVLPLLAVVGLGIAVFTVVNGSKATVPAPPVADPAPSPYQAFVAGSGIVESSTENIAIGTQLPGHRFENIRPDWQPRESGRAIIHDR